MTLVGLDRQTGDAREDLVPGEKSLAVPLRNGCNEQVEADHAITLTSRARYS